MKWLYTKLFCIVLAALFLLLSAISSPADVCSEGWDHAAREAEDEILTAILTQLQTQLSQQETLLKKQEISINNYKQEIAQVNSSLSEASQSLQDEREQHLAELIATGGISLLVGWFIYWLVDAIISTSNGG